MIHNSCRLKLTRRPDALSPPDEKLTVRTRSSETEFNFQTHCLYCGTKLSDQPRDQKDIHSVETLECRTKIDLAISKRPANDAWSLEVDNFM